MHLTVHTDYALRVLAYLSLSGDKLVTINDIANYYGISKNHLVKVVHGLSQEGIIEAVRGRSGGVRLARPADEINIGELVRLTEPGYEMVDCTPDTGACRVMTVCGLPAVLDKATRAFLAELDKHTLADVINTNISLEELV
ncbi:MAG: Rrf2 family transcriptional regulator [Proteobacteria bacterium]|nr:Rrf2 family transcriptional regulator [Pseudomonadota bacterium]